MPNHFHFSSYGRTFWLRFVLGIMLVLVTVRLFYLQVIRHDYYAQQARNIQVSKLSIVPERGKLYALDGSTPVPFVLNETVYTVFADPKELEDPAEVLGAVQAIAGGNVVETFNESQLKDKKRRYVVIARQLTRTQAEKLRAEKLAGVGLQKGSRRVYPEGATASQLLGFVNNDGQGQYGIEGALEKQLAGTPGLLQTVTDVRQIPLTIGEEETSKPAVNGDNIVMSIDRNVQLQAEESLKNGLAKAQATKGSVVVMDPTTGRVMAMANYPTYNVGEFHKVDDTDIGVFQNGIVSDPYEAGSVIKVLSMGAGLDSGAVTVNSTFNDSTGCTQVDDRKICNVEEDPKTANATMQDTLRYSLNTGVVHVLRQMGGGSVNTKARQTLYDYYVNRYHFGRATGIEQAGEAEGIIGGPTQGYGLNVRFANMTFGQGMNVTMIQTAAAFSAAMNGGTYYKPTVVRGVLQPDGSIKEKAPEVVGATMSQASSNTLRELTYQGRHQGFFGKLDPAGYKVGGKTGTSQVIDARTGAYTNENSIGSYLGFGGTDTPQYVIMVRVEDSKLKGGYAGTIAAGPIFNELSNWMLNYLELPPRG